MSGNIGQDIALRTLAPQELPLKNYLSRTRPSDFCPLKNSPLKNLPLKNLPLKNCPSRYSPPQELAPSDYSRPGLLLALLQLAVQGRDDSLCLLYLKVGTLGNLLGSKGHNSLCAVKTYG